MDEIVQVEGSTVIQFSTRYSVEGLAERFGESPESIQAESEEYAKRAFREDVTQMVADPNHGLNGEPLWSGVDHFKVRAESEPERTPEPEQISTEELEELGLTRVDIRYADKQGFPRPTVKKPNIDTLMRQSFRDGQVMATDGCRTDPDGFCRHGHASWMKYLAVV